MTKDLTTVDENRIKYWQWVPYGTIFRMVSYDTSYWNKQKYRWQEHFTEFKGGDEDIIIPDSAVLLSGIPLAYA